MLHLFEQIVDRLADILNIGADMDRASRALPPRQGRRRHACAAT